MEIVPVMGSEYSGKDRYDLAVIGAGPAGSLAAYLAAEAGLNTVLIEKQRLPRSKPCGGFISARALQLLPGEMLPPAELATPVHEIEITRNGRTYRYQSERELGQLLQRKLFDRHLARFAEKKGATLLENTRLVSLDYIKSGPAQGGRYLIRTNPPLCLEARYLACADGAYGTCAPAAGLRRPRPVFTGWALTGTATMPRREFKGLLRFFPLPLLGGMAWSFHGQGWINRGVGGLAGQKKLHQVYNRIFSGEPAYSPPSAWPLPFLGPLLSASRHNLMLLGDTAGLVEPFSGEGIYNSLLSARIFFSALQGEQQGGDITAEAIFKAAFKHHFRRRFGAVLSKAILLHCRSVLFPSTLPHSIAALMENRLWFNKTGGSCSGRA